MTEDDTFNRLRRPPAQEMWDMYRDSVCDIKDIDDFFIKHGWTYDECWKVIAG